MNNPPCLFCRTTGGQRTAVEHIVPEALGNKALILPAGVVCDRCNNGPLSRLDQTLADFHPIRLTRSIAGITGKTGRPVVAPFSTGTATGLPDSVHINLNEGAFGRTFRELPSDDGTLRFRLETAGGRRLTPRFAGELSAAVLKMALEAAWLNHGGLMLAPQFDHVRHAVLNPRARSGWVLVGSKGPGPGIDDGLVYSFTGHSGGSIAVWFVFRGIAIATHSQPTTPPENIGPGYSLLTF